MILRHIPKKAFLLALGDVILISIAFIIAPSIRYAELDLDVVPFTWQIGLIIGIYLLIFYLRDLYEFEGLFTDIKYVLRFIATFLIGTILVATTALFFPPTERPGRGIFLISVVMAGILIYIWRLFFEWVFKRLIERPKKVLIIGAGEAGTSLYHSIKNNSKFIIVGFIDDDPKKWGAHQSPPVFGDFSLISVTIQKHSVDLAVLSIAHENDTALLRSILDCKMKGVDVINLPSFYEELSGKIPVEHVNDSWLVDSSLAGVKRSFYNQKVKRFLDLSISLFSMLLFSPIYVLIAIAIKLDSRGSVFYTQERVGLNNKIFKVVKYRSMIADAENNSAVWAEKDDPRATRVGKFLRKSRIDEIPQLWNVLKNEMSLIGPRPERPEFVKELERTIPYYSLRHFVKPGLTGWAQVNYPYGASEKDAIEKLKYDLFYIKNCSPLLDLHILLKTIKVVIFGKGAR